MDLQMSVDEPFIFIIHIGLLSCTDTSLQYDRAILDLGNVTNSGANTAQGYHSMMYLSWEAVMIKNDQVANGSTYWVSVGAEYADHTEIWVGQAAFDAITDNLVSCQTPRFKAIISLLNIIYFSKLCHHPQDPSGPPTFNFSGPSTIEIGTAAKFTVDMYIAHPSANLTFDAFAPVANPGVLSICGAYITGSGLNYECIDTTKEPILVPDSTWGNNRAILPLGVVTNKGSFSFCFNLLC